MKIIVLFRILAFHLAAYLMVHLSVSRTVGMDNTGAEIMAKCRATMQPPVQMTISTNGVSSLAYRKILPGNVVAARTENLTSSGIVHITVGDQSFELFPEQRKAIESSVLIHGMMENAGKIMRDALTNDTGTIGQEFYSAEEAKHLGHDCWVLTTRFPSDLFYRLSTLSPGLDPERFPFEQKFYVSKTDYLLIMTEMNAKSGTSIARVEYSDIQKAPDLPDDLFLIPESYTLLIPQSKEEYFVLRQSATKMSYSGVSNALQVDRNAIDRPWEQFGIDEAEFRRNVELSKERARKKFVSDLPQPRRFPFGFGNTILSVTVFIALFVYLNLRTRKILLLLRGKK